LLWVAADIGVDERAQRDDPSSALARIIECARDERGAEAPSLECLVDLRVEEREHVAAAIPVDELPCVLAVHQ
jgi:hypothetical protein